MSAHISTRRIVDDLVNTLADDTVSGDSTAVVVGTDPACPSPHRLADTSAAAIASFGREVAALDEDRGAPAQRVSVSAADALDQLRAPFLADLNGVAPYILSDDPTLLGLNDFYPAGDGWVFILSTYPHLRAAACRVLDCPPVAEAIRAKTLRWSAGRLEETLVAAGGVAAAVRTTAQWVEHPVAQHLAPRPVVEIERIGDAPPTPLPPRSPATDGPAWAPLAQLRVVDNTHVIAGPVATRLLAAFGADVLHTSTPNRPDPIGMLAITGGGKANAYADLRDRGTRSRLDALVEAADVFVNSYRNLSAYGFSSTELAARHPGLIYAEMHGWGPDGPWADRGGFDQLACAATGFSIDEGIFRGGTDGQPALPPTHLLNDYLAAYLAAAGITAAVRRRAAQGGSWRVRVNLARVCMWVQACGKASVVDPGSAMPEPSIGRHSVTGPLGTLTEPMIPLIFSHHGTPQPDAPALLGTSDLAFR
jgi:crotonobetainyl-CoA:carnitine CoA-transferase CaiB-like acyl-CoA transferase